MVSAAVAGQVFSAGDIALKQTPSFMESDAVPTAQSQ